MPKILLAWELGGGAGHCANLAPIATRLLERGVDVSIAARDLATAKQTFSVLPVQYLQAPFLVGPPTTPIAKPRSFAHILHNTGFGDENQLEVLSSAWRNLIECAAPDLVVCEHAPMALFASRWFNVRRAVIGTGFFSPPDVTPMPELRYWERSGEANLANDEQTILQRVNDLLDADNRPTLDRLSQLYDVDENFLLTFRELDHYPNRGEAEYWGMWSMPCPTPPEWPDGPAPRVFAYFKAPAANWKLGAVFSLLRELKLTSLVYVAAGDEKWLSQFQTSRLRIVTRPVDMDQVAEQCDLALLNGNAGTCTKLLLAGVPQINIPLFLEQAVFSRRIVELGAGLMAEPNRPEQVAARIVSFFGSDQYTQAAKQFAQRYAEYDPAQSIASIADRIQNLTNTNRA